MPLQPQQQDDQINDEQEHNGHFQYHHPFVRLVVLEQLIQVVQRLQFPIDRPMPIRQVKTARYLFVDAREVPITEEFRRV